jgi:hypothetical protein
MNRQRHYPDRAWGFSLSADEAPVLLNGMRVEFSERVALYPVDLERTETPAPAGAHAEKDAGAPR